MDRLDVWQGSPDEPIQINAVERWIDEANIAFNLPDIVVDPYQLEGTVQVYESNQTVERFEARGGKSNYDMAENLRSCISSQRLVWYPGAGGIPVGGRFETFCNELLGLVLKVTSYGYRFDHTASFHDDRSVSVGMLALHLLRCDPSGPGVLPTPVGQKVANPNLMSRVLANEAGHGLWGLRRGRERTSKNRTSIVRGCR